MGTVRKNIMEMEKPHTETLSQLSRARMRYSHRHVAPHKTNVQWELVAFSPKSRKLFPLWHWTSPVVPKKERHFPERKRSLVLYEEKAKIDGMAPSRRYPEMKPAAGAGAEPEVGWLFLDLNSYFASVEQELRPELRGKAIAVVPVMADTSTVIAASYEAKAFGVKTGVKVGEARRMCPGLELVHARHREYVEYHHRVIEAVERCVPISAVMSIDEMACSLLGRERRLLHALELAQSVKQSIRTHAGATLRCSIGLAPNRYLSKIASDMEKPDGLVALTPDILQAALAGLQLRDLPGVGAQMERRLVGAGIRTMPELLALGREGMRDVWGGAGGDKLWFSLQGEDFHDPKLEHQKSISQSHVLPPELRNPEGAYAVLHKLLHKAAMRLRAARLWTTHVTLSVKYAVPRGAPRGPRESRSVGSGRRGMDSADASNSEAGRDERTDGAGRRPGAPKAVHSSGIPQVEWSQGTSVIECQDTQTLVEALGKLWARRPQGEGHGAPFYVGVWLGELVPDHLHTLSLFSGLESEVEAKRSRIAAAMDAVNGKFGTNTLATASMLLAGASAPTRIAFTNIPDLF